MPISGSARSIRSHCRYLAISRVASLGRDFDEIIHILWEKDFADELVRIFRHTLETGESYVTPNSAEYRADRA